VQYRKKLVVRRREHRPQGLPRRQLIANGPIRELLPAHLSPPPD